MKLMYEDGYKSWGTWEDNEEKEISLEEIKKLINGYTCIFIKAVDVEDGIIHLSEYDVNY